MSSNPRLRYLAAGFALVGRTPRVTPASRAAVRAWERRSGVPLPAALREWFSFCNGRRVLRRYSDEDHPSELGAVGRAYRILDHASWDRPPAPQVVIAATLDGWESTEVLDRLDAPVFVEFMVENQAVLRWHVAARLANGSVPADPPVYADNDTPALARWTLAGPSLSAFLYDWLCEHRYRTDWGPRPDATAAAAEARLPSVRELAQLRRLFAAGPCTPVAGKGGLGWVHRFHGPDGCLRIGWSDFEINPGRVPCWEFRARSLSALGRMLRAVWSMSDVAATVRPHYLADPPVERLLGSMGWSPDRGVRDATWHLRAGMVARREALGTDDPALLRRSVAQLTRAIRLDPTRRLAYEERTTANERLGRVAATLPDLARLAAIAETSSRPFHRLRRARANESLGRHGAAAKDVCAAIELAPDYTDYGEHAARLAAAGRNELARRVYTCWRNHPPQNPSYKERIEAHFAVPAGDQKQSR